MKDEKKNMDIRNAIIEKNVPVSTLRRDKSGITRVILEKFINMEVGDSFVCEFSPSEQATLCHVLLRHGIRYRTSALPNSEWRTGPDGKKRQPRRVWFLGRVRK